MSKAYDGYLKEHIEAVQSGWKWFVEKVGIKKLTEVLPDLSATNIDITVSTHDYSKKWYEEYHAYDHYFYGSRGIKKDGGPDEDVERDFNYAWLHHIHMNEHHWQHWVLIHDDIETNGDPANTIITMTPNGQQICMTMLEMPDYYILEMICDWWSFSWRKGDLYEIFNWWNEHEQGILLGEKTREKVMKLLNLIAESLSEAGDEDEELAHHGILGQTWGDKEK